MKNKLKLTIACQEYDHTRALLDGTVQVEKADASVGNPPLLEIFERMLREQAFDVSEMGFTYYLRTLNHPDSPFVALPIFTMREFAHRSIFLSTASGIEEPRDMVAGKTIGEFAIYGHDAGIMPKGILADEYGFKPEQARWLIGGVDEPMPAIDFLPSPPPAAVDARQLPADKALGPLLETGEIDALIAAMPPKGILEKSPKLKQLFPDYEAIEQAYYQRTGIFPIRHIVVARREVLASHPGLARAIYQAFNASKDVAIEKYRAGTATPPKEPWSAQLLDDHQQLASDNRWSHGVAANRNAVDTFLRYHFEQGLSNQRLTPEDIFAAELLDT